MYCTYIAANHRVHLSVKVAVLLKTQKYMVQDNGTHLYFPLGKFEAYLHHFRIVYSRLKKWLQIVGCGHIINPTRSACLDSINPFTFHVHFQANVAIFFSLILY